MRRRSLLGLLVSAGLQGCGSEPPRPLPPLPRQVAAPDVIVEQLTDLLSVVDLNWVVLIRPHSLASTTWLMPALAHVFEDERIDVAARTTGIDMREVPELAIAGYADGVVLQLVRHQKDQLAVERQFRQRLTQNEIRSELGHQAVSLWGNIGTAAHGFVAIGIDVIGYQYGGSRTQGPGRIALLYALDKLSGAPTALHDAALAQIHAALWADGVPPVEVLFPGPFEGELGRGARGLLAASTGVGVSVAPTVRQTLRLVIFIAGDFGAEESVRRASELLEAAYQDLATADLGTLLGMHQPEVAPVAIDVPFGLGLGVELNAEKLFRGLSAATDADIRDIMR